MDPRAWAREVLQCSRPTTLWEGEPAFGSIYGEEEIEAVVAAMKECADPSQGMGALTPKVEEFERRFADYAGTRHAISINSAGPGLELAMRYLRLEPGDEVIVPAVNFEAAPMAVLGAGGQVIWAEVDPRTLQLDPADVRRRLSRRTRAIFPVHMNGLSAPMDEYLEIASKHPHRKHGPLSVVSDAARACGGHYRGEKIGKKGLLTVFSFQSMKNMSTLGEGGMITTDDDAVAAFCRGTRLYGFGTNPDICGSSYVMSKAQAAVGIVQLRKLDALIEARRRLARSRNEILGRLEEISFQEEPPDCLHTYYLYTCFVPESWAGEPRNRLLEILKKDFRVHCTTANPPVYTYRPVLKNHARGQRVPRSELLGERLFCPPIHPAMSREDNEYICAAIIECVMRMRESQGSR